MIALVTTCVWLVCLGALAGTTASRLKTLKLQSNALRELRESMDSRS